jgi:hypothetical protein
VAKWDLAGKKLPGVLHVREIAPQSAPGKCLLAVVGLATVTACGDKEPPPPPPEVQVVEVQARDTEVRSPMDGLIGLTKVKVGDYMGGFGYSTMNTVSRIDPVHARFSIIEGDYLRFARLLTPDDIFRKDAS